MLASSSLGVERKKKKKRLRQGPHLSEEEEMVRKERAPTKPYHSRMMSLALADPLEGIFVAIEESHPAGPVSIVLPSSLETIDVEVEGGPAPSSTSMGEPKLLTFELEIIKGEAAWAEVARLRAELEALQAEVARLQAVSSQESIAVMFIGAEKSKSTRTNPKVDCVCAVALVSGPIVGVGWIL
ncbi:hypothetical protein ACLOJK_018526 [Asimina triloba]